MTIFSKLPARRRVLLGLCGVAAIGSVYAQPRALLGRGVSPYDFGAKGDGLSDDTAALDAALATGAPVDVGVGRFRLTRGLKLRAQQVLQGVSSRTTQFVVDHEFSRTSKAVLDLSGPEPGGEVRDLAILFTQPDVSRRDALLPYPPAIRAQAVPRFKLSRLRIERARVGVDMRGNSGGATIDDLEISSFDRAIWIDGSLDSVKISKLHVWPFGVTKAQRGVYDDSGNEGLRAGRCDDLHLTDSLFLGLRRAAVFHRSDLGMTIGTLMNVTFDSCGGLVCEQANLRVIGCTFTIGVANASWIQLDEGLMSVIGTWFHANRALDGPGVAAGARSSTFVMNSCVFSTLAADFVHVDLGKGCMFNIDNVTLTKATGDKLNYVKPFILAHRGSRGVISNVVAIPVAGGDLIRIEPGATVVYQALQATKWRLPN